MPLLPGLWRKLGFPIASCLIPLRIAIGLGWVWFLFVSLATTTDPAHCTTKYDHELSLSVRYPFSTSIGSWHNNKIYTFMVLFSRLCWRFFRKSQGRCNHRILCTSQLKSNNTIKYIAYSRSSVRKRKQNCYLNCSRLWHH